MISGRTLASWCTHYARLRALLAVGRPAAVSPLSGRGFSGGPAMAPGEQSAHLEDQRRLHRPGRAQGHGRVFPAADEPSGRAAVRLLPVERGRALVAHGHRDVYGPGGQDPDPHPTRRRLDHGGRRRRDDALLSSGRLRRGAGPAGGSEARAGADVRRDVRPRRSALLRQGSGARRGRLGPSPALHRARHPGARGAVRGGPGPRAPGRGRAGDRARHPCPHVLDFHAVRGARHLGHPMGPARMAVPRPAAGGGKRRLARRDPRRPLAVPFVAVRRGGSGPPGRGRRGLGVDGVQQPGGLAAARAPGVVVDGDPAQAPPRLDPEPGRPRARLSGL